MKGPEGVWSGACRGKAGGRWAGAVAQLGGLEWYAEGAADGGVRAFDERDDMVKSQRFGRLDGSGEVVVGGPVGSGSGDEDANALFLRRLGDARRVDGEKKSRVIVRGQCADVRPVQSK